MKKPQALRAALEAALPELKRQSDRLSIYIKSGSVESWWSPTQLSFSYSYTLNLTFLDFPGHPSQVMLPILIWLKDNEIAAMQNTDTAAQLISFDVDIVDAETVDLDISLKLTESVRVRPRDDAKPGYQMEMIDEPPAVGFDLFDGVPGDALIDEVYGPDGDLIYKRSAE